MIVYIILVVLALVVGFYIAKEAWREKQLNTAARKIDPTTFAELSRLIPKVGSTEPQSYFLINRRKTKTDGSFQLAFPPNFPINWLANRVVAADFDTGTSDDDFGKFQILKEGYSDFEIVGIPRVTLKNGQVSHRYQPSYWMKKNEHINHLAKQVYPRDPDQLLSRLFDNSGRIGAPFCWVQQPWPMKCRSCKEKAFPAMQIAGHTIGCNAEFTFYVGACNCSPDVFLTQLQMT